ncbi:LysR family transcriptional regulator [Aquamicrobium zhengzhouense]|uniref:LysR family transcriptional regulator n=1 Tax=Aquamicrobium zhengzhouense TaxID=2781738 RepID=A0ABS0SB50_9HYPH|nr:LysR family transcriptional regulator [Aquamicrobium zhengzhouense]MBI1620481.1 LysR family transcriptional regulator [Aquamicrobium zhengzhouense]
MKPDFMEARAFVAIVDSGSFVMASKQLRLSPSRVSELLMNFEERLGVRLVERTTRSVSPTLAGEMLYARLSPLLDEFVHTLERTREFNGSVAGLLRLTVAPPAADSLLAPHLSEFLSMYPDVSVELSVDGDRVDIVTERFDAGIRFGGLVHKDMIAVKISEPIPLVVVASPEYLAKHGTPASPHELENHCCFNVRLAGGAALPWRFQQDGKSMEMQFEGRIIVNKTGMQIKAAEDGLGLFQSPRSAVAEALKSGKLVTVLDDYAPPALDGFYLYYPSRRLIRPALKALVDFLRQKRREI